MTEKDTINRPQLMSLTFVSLLSPIIRLLPKGAVELAGRMGWLSCAVACVPLALLVALISAMQKKLPPGEGMGNVFTRCMGKVFGRVLLLLYSVWLLFYVGFLLLSGASRFISTVYPGSGPWIFVGVMLVLCLTAALGRVRVLGRMSRVLLFMLLTVLVLVFAFSLLDVQLSNVWPPVVSDAVPVLLGALPVVNVISVFSYFSFLSCYNAPDVQDVKTFQRWLLATLAVCALLCFTTTGVFGAELTKHVTSPFFVMIRDLSMLKILQRIEALVIAMWVFTDFVLETTLLRVAESNLRLLAGFSPVRQVSEQPVGGLRGLFTHGRWLIWVCAAAALAAAILLSPGSIKMPLWSGVIIPLINMCFVFIGFPLVFIVGKLRKRL